MLGEVAEPHQWKYERQPIPVEHIRWSQETIGIRFRDGTLLFDTLQQMLAGKIKPDVLPTFRVVLYEDLLYAVTGNRRLWVLKAYQRLSGRPVRVIAECHPPAAMKTQWCKRRYSTSTQGESVRFVCKSFADCTYAEMQEALWAANQRKHAQTLAMLEAEVGPEKQAEEAALEAQRASELAQAQALLRSLDAFEDGPEDCWQGDATETAHDPGQGGSTSSVDNDTATTELPQEGERETPLEVFPATDDEEEVDDAARKALNSLMGVPDQSSNSYVPVGLHVAAQQLLADPSSTGPLYPGAAGYPPDLTPEGWVDCAMGAWQTTLMQDGAFDFPGYFEPDWSLISQTWEYASEEAPPAAASMPTAMQGIQAVPFQVWQMHLAGQLSGLGFLIDPSQASGGARFAN
ncbi:unnamed protein product [Symbiodinium natans]|uniref:Uncharacterized protein n=1 Tax=Symbiodinium natans TaxID=878477 RepID=A0A812SND7_9DINO|nr:unnamed protein product [Symbiodinium natans]